MTFAWGVVIFRCEERSVISQFLGRFRNAPEWPESKIASAQGQGSTPKQPKTPSSLCHFPPFLSDGKNTANPHSTGSSDRFWRASLGKIQVTLSNCSKNSTFSTLILGWWIRAPPRTCGSALTKRNLNPMEQPRNESSVKSWSRVTVRNVSTRWTSASSLTNSLRSVVRLRRAVRVGVWSPLERKRTLSA